MLDTWIFFNYNYALNLNSTPDLEQE